MIFVKFYLEVLDEGVFNEEVVLSFIKVFLDEINCMMCMILDLLSLLCIDNEVMYLDVEMMNFIVFMILILNWFD